LSTERTNVTETAERVGGDDTGTRREAVVLGLWVLLGNKLSESNELVGNDLDTDETADEEEILAFTRHTEQESYWVENVAEDELQSKIVLALESDVATPPGEETVDHVEEGDDTQKGGYDHPGDLETEPGTVGESVESVCGFVLIIVGDDNSSSSESLFRLGVTKLAEREMQGYSLHKTRSKPGG